MSGDFKLSATLRGHEEDVSLMQVVAEPSKPYTVSRHRTISALVILIYSPGIANEQNQRSAHSSSPYAILSSQHLAITPYENGHSQLRSHRRTMIR